jgi:hypothetical protein
MRSLWPLLVGLTLVFMVGAYLVAQAYLAPAWAGVIAFGIGAAFILGVVQLPQTTVAWRRGAEGERRTAKYLDGLIESGFVVLHDRKVPGYGGNLDHIAIGPSGVWAIETKRLSGKVVIDGDRLRIGGRRQDKIIDQVYRQAAALQVALRDLLDPLSVTITPIICLHDGELPWFNRTVRGVRLTSGRGLVRTMRDASVRLTPAQVQTLAAATSERMRSAVRS